MSAPVFSHPPLDAAVRRPEPRSARARRPVTDAAPPGTVVGSFVLGEVVEHDDFRLCYRARATASDADVLIEEYWPKALAQRGEDGDARLREPNFAELYDAGLQAFVAESEALATLEDRALVRIGPMWLARATAYRLRVDTATRRLSQHLEDHRHPADEAWLRGLAEPLLGALACIHRAGRVHGNVRPASIALRDDGAPVLLDFDAARVAIARLAPWRAVSPEPGYTAPELALYGVVATPAADLYSLAAVLWYCSTGELPENPGAGQAAPPSRWQSVLERHPSLRYSAGWMAALERALAFDPAVRPQDADAFRRLLATAPSAPSGLEAVRGTPASPEARRAAPVLPEAAAWPVEEAASEPAWPSGAAATQAAWPTSAAEPEPAWSAGAASAAPVAPARETAPERAGSERHVAMRSARAARRAARTAEASSTDALGSAAQPSADRPRRAAERWTEPAPKRTAGVAPIVPLAPIARVEPLVPARPVPAEPVSTGGGASAVDDSEPAWQLPIFAGSDAAARVDPDPWPTSGRSPVFDDRLGSRPSETGVPWARRAAPPRPKRHWPWALGGALVGGAAMLVFGLGERRLDELSLSAWFSKPPAAASADAGLPPSVATGVAAMQGAAPPAAGGDAAARAAADTAARTATAAQPATPYALPPAGASPDATRAAGAVASVAPAAPGLPSAAPAVPAAPAAARAETTKPVAPGAVRADGSRRAAAGPDLARAQPAEAEAVRNVDARREVTAAALDPAAVCAPRSNFSLYWCMKTQCERAANYTHPQCIALRREDDR